MDYKDCKPHLAQKYTLLSCSAFSSSVRTKAVTRSSDKAFTLPTARKVWRSKIWQNVLGLLHSVQ